MNNIVYLWLLNIKKYYSGYMVFKEEINRSLEQIEELKQCFLRAEDAEILPVSFFSSSYDILKSLANTLHSMEKEQLRLMEEQLQINRASFLETEGLLAQATIEPDSLEEDKIISDNENVTASDYIEEIPASEKTEKLLENYTPSSSQALLENSLFQEIKVEVKKEVKVLGEMQKQISLNDKFRFQREIFKGSAEDMNHVMDELNKFLVLEDAIQYAESQPWDSGNEIVEEFKEFIRKRFV